MHLAVFETALQEHTHYKRGSLTQEAVEAFLACLEPSQITLKKVEAIQWPELELFNFWLLLLHCPLFAEVEK